MKRTLKEDLERIHSLTYGEVKSKVITEWVFGNDEKEEDPKKADEVSDDVKEFFSTFDTIIEGGGLTEEEVGSIEYKKSVESMQIGLVILGYELPRHGVDGLFGPETAEAVRSFTSDNDLEVNNDGPTVASPEMIGKLKEKLSNKGLSSEDLEKHVNKPIEYDGSMGERTDGVTIARYLMSKRYTKAQAAGIAGNLYVESGYKTGALGDSGTSYGLAQWHKTRWERLMDFCNQEGLDPSKAESQLIYLDWELRNREKKAFNELMKTDTPYDSAYVFAKYYERPRKINPKRMSKAEEIYNQLS